MNQGRLLAVIGPVAALLSGYGGTGTANPNDPNTLGSDSGAAGDTAASGTLEVPLESARAGEASKTGMPATQKVDERERVH